MRDHTAFDSVERAAATIPVGYTGATLWGISMPDWAAILAGVVSICLIIQMMYRGYAWAQEKFSTPEAKAAKRRRAADR